MKQNRKAKGTEPAPAPSTQAAALALEGAVMRFEENHVTIRNEKGWLLWKAHVRDLVGNGGADMADVARAVAQRMNEV